MKSLFLLILLSVNVHAETNSCAALAPMLDKFHRELMSGRIKDCDFKTVPPSLKSISETDPNFLEKNQCNTLDSVETDLARLENLSTLLKGIAKIKLDVKKQKKGAEEEDKKAGKDFAEALTKAVVVEELIKAPDHKELPVLKELSVLKDRNINSITLQIGEICKDQNSKVGVCALTKEQLTLAKDEVETLIQKSKDLKPDEFSKLKDSLVIMVGDKPTSFSKIYADMKDVLPKLTSGSKLSREDLAALKKVPDFKSAQASLPFLKTILDSDKVLALKKDAGSPNRFLFQRVSGLVEELKIRQQVDLKNKLSLAWSMAKSEMKTISDADKTKCDEASADIKKIKPCVEALTKMGPELQKIKEKAQVAPSFINLVAGLSLSADYEQSLPDKNNVCLSEEKLKEALAKDEVPACLPKPELTLLQIDAQVAALNEIKKLINSNQEDVIAFHNHTLDLLKQDNCEVTKTESQVGCYQTDSAINPEISLLAFTGSQIAVAYANQTTKVEISAICEKQNFKDVATSAEREKLCNKNASGIPLAVVPEKTNASRSPSSPSQKTTGGVTRDVVSYVDPINYGQRDVVRNGIIQSALAITSIFTQPTFPPYYTPAINNYVPVGGNQNSISGAFSAGLAFKNAQTPSRYFQSMQL